MRIPETSYSVSDLVYQVKFREATLLNIVNKVRH